MGTILGQLFQRSDDLLDFDIRNFEGKAILGDLKSGYLNSFGAFLTRSWSADAREKLKSIRTLPELYALCEGKEKFVVRVNEFDEGNLFLIQLYQHHLQTLTQFLSENEKPLLQQLQPLSEVLYWRKKPE